jgi:FHS family Na+ dependent glucose MFS transporter 1
MADSTVDHNIHYDEVSTRSKNKRLCGVSHEDVPNVVASFACFACFLMNGAGAASLGAALPELCEHFHKSTAEMGMAFTARGIGYTIGTVMAALILSQKYQYFSKEFLASLSLILAGVMALFVTVTDNFYLVLVWFGFQGMGFGGIETMVNVAMPAIWGRRVQPWMQAVFSCFGLGSMIGPALVGSVGYHIAFPILAICSFLPAVILGGYQIVKYNRLYRCLPVCCQISKNSPSRGGGAADVDEDGDIETQAYAAGEKEEIILVATPFYLKMILATFIFAYVGIEIGFAGWIPSYALAEGITDSKSKAAYLVSVFWTTITCGRMISTVAAIYISATSLIRFQLAYALVSTLLGMTVMAQSYSIATIVCACIGLSLSSIYPAMITIIGEYGFKM